MMHIFLLIIGLFFYNIVGGQYKGPNFQIQDKWFEELGRNGLQEGDTMPDILLGKILNFRTGKERFSELRNKLIILDFWFTGCSSCLEKFPEMEELQKKFDGDIQI